MRIGTGKLDQARRKIERQMILQALNRWSGNVTYAAADLGISRPTLYDLIKKHGISTERKYR
jgi:two-component system, NtrC family, response regulator